MSDTSTIIIRVPRPIKEQLQITAIKKQSNMNEIINQLIVEYLEK